MVEKYQIFRLIIKDGGQIMLQKPTSNNVFDSYEEAKSHIQNNFIDPNINLFQYIILQTFN